MVPAKLLDAIKEQARKLKKTVVLPDALDERSIHAARIIKDEEIANPVLIGDEQVIREKAQSLNVGLEQIRVVDPKKSEKLSDFTHIFFNLRKNKGVDFIQAGNIISHPPSLPAPSWLRSIAADL